ncbi:MAG: hypothetical protein L3J51_08950 [Cocleimonas sp.]|nr:hypothetical protein [Cocleimonas sp.]
MKHNTNYTLIDTLHYNTLLSNQVFKIDSTNNLHIVELAPLRNKNETIPLDLIDANPLTKKKLDTHLILLTLVSTLTSAIFFVYAFYAYQIWANAFATVFLLSSLSTLFFAYKNRAISYTYQFANTNTPLFTLRECFSKNEQVKMFVNALNKRIVNVNEQTDLDSVNYFNNDNTNNTKSSECTKHLDFLYNHGFVDDALYQRIDRKIHHRFFGKNDAEKASTENVIYFPVKA